MNQNENKHYSTLDEMNEYLEHHGIKGQKWGVRRTPEQLGHKVASGAKKAVSAAGGAIDNQYKKSKAKAAVKKVSKQKAKAEKKAHDAQVKKDRDFSSVKNLTNQELSDRINRLRAEATYKQLLNDANGKTVKKGKNIYLDAFGKGSSAVVEKAVKAKGADILNKWLANEANPNPTGFYNSGLGNNKSGKNKQNKEEKISNKTYSGKPKKLTKK